MYRSDNNNGYERKHCAIATALRELYLYTNVNANTKNIFDCLNLSTDDIILVFLININNYYKYANEVYLKICIDIADIISYKDFVNFDYESQISKEVSIACRALFSSVFVRYVYFLLDYNHKVDSFTFFLR